MKKRLKYASVIYLALVGAGVVAYFGIETATKGYGAVVSGGDTDIFKAGTEGDSGGKKQEAVRVPTPGESGYEAQQTTPGAPAATQEGNQETPGETPAQNPGESQNQEIALGQETGPGINPNPSEGEPKFPVNKTDFPDVKSDIDLSGKLSGGPVIDLGKSGPQLSGPSPDIKLQGPDLSGSKVPDVGSSGSLSSGNPAVLDMEKDLESAYRNSHDLSKARSVAKKILRLDPTNSRAKFYLKLIKAEARARSYEDAGEPEKALAEWKKILKWDPGNKWAQRGVDRNQ